MLRFFSPLRFYMCQCKTTIKKQEVTNSPLRGIRFCVFCSYNYKHACLAPNGIRIRDNRSCLWCRIILSSSCIWCCTRIARRLCFYALYGSYRNMYCLCRRNIVHIYPESNRSARCSRFLPSGPNIDVFSFALLCSNTPFWFCGRLRKSVWYRTCRRRTYSLAERQPRICLRRK